MADEISVVLHPFIETSMNDNINNLTEKNFINYQYQIHEELSSHI